MKKNGQETMYLKMSGNLLRGKKTVMRNLQLKSSEKEILSGKTKVAVKVS